MPRYEFSCSTCGQVFERDLPASADRSGVECPAGHRRVQRVYSAPPVMFRGGGFYVTDHRRSPASSEASGKA